MGLWLQSFPPRAWQETPDYLGLYFGYVSSRPLEALLRVEAGPLSKQGWFVIPVYVGVAAITIGYIVGKKSRLEIVIVNRRYIVYLILLGLFAITFQNAAQFYNWYWNPELNAPGFVDTWTHLTSPWFLGALVAPLSIERIFRWDRKHGWFFVAAVNAISALGWEIAESSASWDPSPGYFNYPMDSVKDIVMGAFLATVVAWWFYERLVVELADRSRKVTVALGS
ncbi:MAG: hypothetical protein OEW84_02615 [Aigarchaeota archaeon]|nr:hypothetical protein [Aigarchaeota archaeon]